jgi:hypothetical protein
MWASLIELLEDFALDEDVDCCDSPLDVPVVSFCCCANPAGANMSPSANIAKALARLLISILLNLNCEANSPLRFDA